MSGPSTSEITKAELLRRLREISIAEGGDPISSRLLDDLIKDGLMPAGRRVGNEGKRPLYRYAEDSLRRGRQVIALRVRGIRDREAMRLQLFLAGESVLMWEVRTALWSEYRRHIASLLSSIRSRYLDNDKPVPPEHLARLINGFGSLHPAFEAAGLRQPDAYYVDAMRKAKGSALDLSSVALSETAEHLIGSVPTWSWLWDLGIHFLNGLMMVGEAAQDGDAVEIDYVEKLIETATDAELKSARDFLATFPDAAIHTPELAKLLSLEATPEFVAAAKVAAGSPRQPEWAALLLVFVLALQKKTAIDFSILNMECVLELARQGFTIRDFADKIGPQFGNPDELRSDF